MSQGKAWDRDKVVEVLEPYLKLGFTTTKACKCAGIPHNTVSDWVKYDPELRLKFESWRNMVSVAATQNWAQMVVKEKDYEASKEWLEFHGEGAIRPDATNILVINAGANPYEGEAKKYLPDTIKVLPE